MSRFNTVRSMISSAVSAWRWPRFALLGGLVLLSGCAELVAASPRTLHFSDCQTGAAAGCVAGSNSNPGTEAAPKRDLRDIEVRSLAAGTTLLFRRGGAWNVSRVDVENVYSTAAQPITFAAYGSGPRPIMRTASGVGWQVGGGWQNTTDDGGYVFRSLELLGTGNDDTHWGFYLQRVRDVVLDDVRISGFGLGMHAIHGPIRGLVVRNSEIVRNRSMGLLVSVSDSRFEDSLYEGNNFSGSGFDHAIYLSRGNNNVVRGNRFLNNSVVAGQCRGGNFTLHGSSDGLLIENNTIEVPDATNSCYGFSITAGYTDHEEFRKVVLRGNTVINTGICSMCINSSPGIVVEGNRIFTPGRRAHYGIWAEANGKTDTPSNAAVIRDNVLCRGPGAEDVRLLQWSPAGASQGNNVTRTGAEASQGPCAR